MRDYVSEFPAVNHVIGAYFHEDWRSHGATPDDVVRFFARVEPLKRRREGVAQIGSLLASVSTEDELADALRQFGCAYDVKEFEPSIRSWLQHVRELIALSTPGVEIH